MVFCVFSYFENLLSVQEEARRNEGKKKNKQKTGVSLEELVLFISDMHIPNTNPRSTCVLGV